MKAKNQQDDKLELILVERVFSYHIEDGELFEGDLIEEKSRTPIEIVKADLAKESKKLETEFNQQAKIKLALAKTEPEKYQKGTIRKRMYDLPKNHPVRNLKEDAGNWTDY